MAIVKIVTGVFVTLTFAGAALAQDVGTKSINTGGEKGAYHALFCPPLPVALPMVKKERFARDAQHPCLRRA